MRRSLKTIKVDWLEAARLEMYAECSGVAVVSVFPQTVPSTREGP